MSSESCLEFVVRDLLGRDADFLKHPGACLDHHGWTAQIVFHRLRVRVFGEVVFKHRVVDEAGITCPVVLRQRRGERKMKSEIAMRAGQILEEIFVKHLLL